MTNSGNGSLEDLQRADAAKGGSGASEVLSSLQVWGSLTRHICVLSEEGTGPGLCTTLLVQESVTCCIFKMQVWGLLVGGFQPLLKTEQGNKGVLRMERGHHSLLFLLTSSPAGLAYPAELC